MTRDEAFALLSQHVKTPNLIKHMLATEALMRGLAGKFGDDEEKWGVAGLLHDTIEDTLTTLEEIEERFGAAVRYLVDGMTEVGKGEGETPIPDKTERVRRTWEKVDRYALEDPRIYLIKTADRWHNLLTSGTLRRGTQLRWIKEVRDRCIPLCRRIGRDRVPEAA